MSSSEIMNSDLVSYELARDMAEVANTAHTVMREAEAAVDAAQLIERVSISGVALEAGSLAVLAGRYRVAGNSFNHAYNSVPSFCSEVLDDNANSETLTPEEQAYKETALEQLKVSFSSYENVMGAMNSHRNPQDKLSVAGEEQAKTALEAILTPAMIRAEMAQIAEFTANPEENSPEAGFDTLFIPNAKLTAKDETVVANNLQARLTAYKGEAYTYEPLHNDATAHTATSLGAEVLAVRVPKHLNVRKGVATEEKTAVQDQADNVNAHNNDPNTSYCLQMATDMEALAHIALQIETGAVDATNPNYDEKRFWSTYYKNVLQEPVGGCVSSVCVYDDGQLSRGGSDVHYGGASRALVVPKA